jgi:hypothetical protein
MEVYIRSASFNSYSAKPSLFRLSESPLLRGYIMMYVYMYIYELRKNQNVAKFSLHIVTYKGFVWLITMGSRFDDWVYWHFFTITLDHNSSHIELLLNICLTDLYEESLMNLGLISRSALPFITFTRPGWKSLSPRVPLLFFMNPLSRNLMLIHCNAFIPPSVFVAAKSVLTIRCLAMDYFVTICFLTM